MQLWGAVLEVLGAVLEVLGVFVGGFGDLQVLNLHFPLVLSTLRGAAFPEVCSCGVPCWRFWGAVLEVLGCRVEVLW